MKRERDSTADRLCGSSGTEAEPSVRTVRIEAVLAMAELLKDFRPLQVFGGQQAEAARVLHPMWMSGLVGEAVRRLCEGCVVNHLGIEHIAEGREEDTLHVLLETDGSPGLDAGKTIRLRVVNGKGKVLAVGAAEVIRAIDVSEARCTGQ